MKRTTANVLAAIILAACSTQEKDFLSPAMDDAVFYASFEQPAEEGTRVYANENLLLRWTADDRVSIFNRITYNQQYKFTGETGDNAGGFRKVDTDEFVTGNTISNVVSVYPYHTSTKITEDEVLTVTLPAEQNYSGNTFGLGSNTMVSVSSDNVLQYKTVGGYLVFKLYGDGVSVSSITLRGNNGETLAGKATVTMPLDGLPSVELTSDATTEIILTCENPVQLGATAEESTQFWFVVPPITFDKGFTVSVTNASGIVFEKSTSKSITIERNILSKMSPMAVSSISIPVPEAVDLGLPSGVKWASLNLGASMPEWHGGCYAWGETGFETDGQSGLSWGTYKWCFGNNRMLFKYCNDPSYGHEGFTDYISTLDLEDDAAHAHLGDKWRMPTDAEWLELMENCTWTWTTRNDVKGRLVTASNGNSIFLPAAGMAFNVKHFMDGVEGHYWSSSLDLEHPDMAWHVCFDSENVSLNSYSRCYGFSIRPVYGDRELNVESVFLNKTLLELKVGNSSNLVATVIPGNAANKSVTWSSSDDSVAAVSSTGLVTGVAEGSAVITVTTVDGGKTATCNVTVRKASPSSLTDPDAVDLGLPSGLKWASFNLGASKPEGSGDWYAWGETEPYYISSSINYSPVWKEGKETGYSWASYKWCTGTNNTLTKYCTNSEYGIVDDKTILDIEDDAANAFLGGAWRIPTDAEWGELLRVCSTKWTFMSGVLGREITGPNGNSIFLPVSGFRSSTFRSSDSLGFYWSSSLYSDFPSKACYVLFDRSIFAFGQQERCLGYSVRPVSE